LIEDLGFFGSDKDKNLASYKLNASFSNAKKLTEVILNEEIYGLVHGTCNC
jgi:hypothetical protein